MVHVVVPTRGTSQHNIFKKKGPMETWIPFHQKVRAKEEKNLRQRGSTPGYCAPQMIKKYDPTSDNATSKFSIIAAKRPWLNIPLGVFPQTRNTAKHGIVWEAKDSNTSGHLVQQRQVNRMGELPKQGTSHMQTCSVVSRHMLEEVGQQMQAAQPATPTTTLIPTHRPTSAPTPIHHPRWHP